MWSTPVTFGGGTAIVYLGFGLAASATNSRASCQRADSAGLDGLGVVGGRHRFGHLGRAATSGKGLKEAPTF